MKNMTKHFSTVALAVTLTVGMALPAFAAQYNDVSGNWAQQAIGDLSQKGIVSGYPSGEFRPSGSVTRAEFASMLVKAMNTNTQQTYHSTNYSDVPSNFWGHDAIASVSDSGLFSGYPGGQFRPSQNISMVEALSVLVKASGIAVPNNPETINILKNFSDSHQVPGWSQPAVAAAIHSGIFVNFPNGNLIEPNKSVNRAGIAALTQNFVNLVASRTSTPVAGGYGQNNGSTMGSATQQGNTIQGYVSVVPAQTIFTASATQAFSSDRSQVGDRVTLTLDKPILSTDGKILVPQGSKISGSINRIVASGLSDKPASVGLDLNQMMTPDGQTFAISAEINTTNGQLKAGTTKGRVLGITARTLGGAALGAGAGALLGQTVGDHKPVKGLVLGSIIGGGVGAATAILNKGNELDVEPGELLELRLRQPMSVSSI